MKWDEVAAQYREKWIQQDIYREKFLPFKRTVHYMEKENLIKVANTILLNTQRNDVLSVLDIGCGDATMSVFLLNLLEKEIATYVGIDPNTEAIKTANEKLKKLYPNVQLINSYFDYSEIDMSHVNLVLSLHSIYGLDQRTLMAIINGMHDSATMLMLACSSKGLFCSGSNSLRYKLNSAERIEDFLIRSSVNFESISLPEFDFFSSTKVNNALAAYLNIPIKFIGNRPEIEKLIIVQGRAQSHHAVK